MADSKAFVPNTTPPPTDNAVRARRPDADASDKTTQKGVTSITGNKLTGQALADFTAAYEGSAMLRGTYNPDGTMKADIKAITE